MKKYDVMFIGLILLYAYLIFGLVGCAALSCTAPEVRAAAKGVVLECRSKMKNGHPVKSCLVMVPGGNTVNVSYRRCPAS